jgi:hypothetical protein
MVISTTSQSHHVSPKQTNPYVWAILVEFDISKRSQVSKEMELHNQVGVTTSHILEGHDKGGIQQLVGED